jgi:hypothetical protein
MAAEPCATTERQRIGRQITRRNANEKMNANHLQGILAKLTPRRENAKDSGNGEDSADPVKVTNGQL